MKDRFFSLTEEGVTDLLAQENEKYAAFEKEKESKYTVKKKGLFSSIFGSGGQKADSPSFQKLDNLKTGIDRFAQKIANMEKKRDQYEKNLQTQIEIEKQFFVDMYDFKHCVKDKNEIRKMKIFSNVIEIELNTIKKKTLQFLINPFYDL